MFIRGILDITIVFVKEDMNLFIFLLMNPIRVYPLKF